MLVNRLQDMLIPTVEALGYEIVGCTLGGGSGHRKIFRVYVDSEQGVTSEACAKISRQVSAMLDVIDPISGHYELEVSSPGVERPLFTVAHYQRFLGRKVRWRLHQGHGERRSWQGIIQAVEGDVIVFQVADTLQRMSFSDIERAHLSN
ncbi:MAG: hypothetical protein A3F41_07150 [Coxiella sp. RIFCSPHIGHO2_12_FULL_44_14]|nr:MAG: hypothetical protein A3F41_07150 [Coxiella sp. RIFCSPHIGHO2_12_FULL_44_14]